MVLYPSWRSGIFLLAVSSFFVVVGLATGSSGKRLGYLIAAFFSLGVVAGASLFVPRMHFLRIEKSGFTIRNMLRDTFVRWQDVELFYVVEHGYSGITTNRHVVFRYLDGRQGLLPQTYGKKASALAALMNQYLLQNAQPPQSP